MLELKRLTLTLLVACLISTNSCAHSSVSIAAAGVMILGFSTLIDVSIIQQTNRLKKDYDRAEMVVVGYQIDKAPCKVCMFSSTHGYCIDTNFKAQVKNEFLTNVNGTETTQHVLSESICGTNENDANVTATTRFPLETKTAIWYKKTNASEWQKAGNPELEFISKCMYYAGGAAFLLGYTLYRFEQYVRQDG